MSLVSATFLLFCAVLFCVYFIVPKKIRWVILLIASYFFYLCALGSKPWMLACIVLTTVSMYLGGRLLERNFRLQNEEIEQSIAGKDKKEAKEIKKEILLNWQKYRRRIIAVTVSINLLSLCIFKYLIGENKLLVAEWLRIPIEQLDASILVPIGLSFFTFQAIAYIVDVYREKFKPEHNFLKFALYISFFPQIVQGPIARYDELSPSLFAGNKFEYTRFKHGLQLIAFGFFKKTVIGDRAAIYVNAIAPNYADFSGASVLLSVVGYAFQIYGDFSGGIDIARGVAHCLGIEMAENFVRPYFAFSLMDYWRRWHKTLGGFMKEYFFYPISLSKPFAKMGKYMRKKYKNTFGKMFATCVAMTLNYIAIGIWHGSSPKYLVFGFYHGILITIGILMRPKIQEYQKTHPNFTAARPINRILLTLGTFVLVLGGRYFSTADSLPQAMGMWKQTLTYFHPSFVVDEFNRTGFGLPNLIILGVALLILFFISFLQERGVRIREALDSKPLVVRWLVYALMMTIIMYFSVNSSNDAKGFIYANF